MESLCPIFRSKFNYHFNFGIYKNYWGSAVYLEVQGQSYKAHQSLDMRTKLQHFKRDGITCQAGVQAAKQSVTSSAALTCFIKARYKNDVIWFSTGAVMPVWCLQVILPSSWHPPPLSEVPRQRCFCHFVFLATIKRKTNLVKKVVSR